MPESRRGASLRLETIAKTYGDVAALTDITVEVSAGEFFTLLGPSGSGKTTLLQIIAGFVEPTRGTLLMDGQPLAGVPPQRRNLGIVFQSYALFPHLTVFENIAFPLRVRRLRSTEIGRRVNGALEMVRLDGLGHRLPRQLSGGQQQRVAVARALVFEPRIMLMDEPLGALDKKLREEMQSEMKDLQRRLGATFIYVTHDQDEALRLSDRVAVMRHGMLEHVGTPTEVYNAPATLFVADFLGESNFLRGIVTGHDASGGVLVRLDTGGTLCGTPTTMLETGRRVVAALRPERVLLIDGPGSPSCATGLIEQSLYAGDATRWRIRTMEHGALVVKEQNAPHRPMRRPGDTVRVHWLTADIMVFAMKAEDDPVSPPR